MIGNTATAVVHRILEKAITNDDIAKRYGKEILNSLDIAKIYREKINPPHTPLHDRDAQKIQKKIVAKVKSELLLRISKGYTNIDLTLIDTIVNDALKELRILLER